MKISLMQGLLMQSSDFSPVYLLAVLVPPNWARDVLGRLAERFRKNRIIQR